MLTNYGSGLSQIIKPFQLNQVLKLFLIKKYYMKCHKDFKPGAVNLVYKL